MAEPAVREMRRGSREMLAPLGEPRFRMLFGARVTSIAGDRVLPLALAFAVLDLTGSPGQLGLVLAAYQVATTAMLLGGGVLADRLERRRLMVATDLAQVGAQGLMALLLVTGRASIWELVALQAVSGAANGLFRPASSGIVPQTVPREQLQRANALLRLASSLGTVVGPALAGPLVAFAGAGWAIGVNAASFAASAVLTAGIGTLRPPLRERSGPLAELATGWREVRARPWVLRGIADFALFQLVVLGSLSVLGPVVARDALGGPVAWGAILSALGLGAVLGAAAGLRLRTARPLRTGFAASLLYPTLLVALAVPLPLAAVAACAFVGGTVMVMADTLWLTVLQTHVPEHVLSRVSSFDWLGSSVLYPAGLALAGPVAAVAGTPATLLAAAGIFSCSTLALLVTGALRDPAPAEAAG